MCQCMGGVGCGSGGWIEVWLDQGGVAQEDGLKCGLIRVVWPRRMD